RTQAPQACLSAYSSTLANGSLNLRLAYYSTQAKKVKGFFHQNPSFLQGALCGEKNASGSPSLPITQTAAEEIPGGCLCVFVLFVCFCVY
ncbi:hypothetical protein, partial [Vescimonas sp.]|uniref:hypothetical protein n=1 Tax=Vescimonas sp. TaxID=2892404 RepID=UPI00307945FF